MKHKYYIKFGYFGQNGRKYIPFWKYLVYKIFTDYALYKEGDE